VDRREFLNAGIIGTLAAKVLSDTTLARAQAPAAAAQGAGTAATPRKLIMDAYTRHLHWLRNHDEIAEAAIEMTCGGVNPTIQNFPGHIDPAKVTTELPAFVKTMQKHGLRVKQVRGGNQTAVDVTVETLVGTMSQSGVTHYWLGTDNYDLTKPILPQLDAIKAKVERFVKLNEKHGTTMMYHTRAGANSVGSVVWDLLYVMKDFDPKYVGFHWDTGHMSHHGAMWETLMRTAGPYVVAMGWKDRSWQQELGLLGEGGPYPGPTEEFAALNAGRAAGAAAAVPMEMTVPPPDVAAGVDVVAARDRFRSRWRVTRSRAAAAGSRRTSRWAWGWSTSSAMRPCCATSGSTDRWSSRRNTRWAGRRTAMRRLRCRERRSSAR
jgi:hypothetical protein